MNSGRLICAHEIDGSGQQKLLDKKTVFIIHWKFFGAAGKKQSNFESGSLVR